MKKKRVGYRCHCYRYAPEQFRAFKGLRGQPYESIRLSPDQVSTAGLICITKSAKEALDYVKRIDRHHQRRQSLHKTYGFCLVEKPYRFAYYPQLYCDPEAPLKERLGLFQSIRSKFQESGGKIDLPTVCELDGHYQPSKITKQCWTIDFTRPVVVWLRSA